VIAGTIISQPAHLLVIPTVYEILHEDRMERKDRQSKR
jgi:hypothetical protein